MILLDSLAQKMVVERQKTRF